MQTVRTGVIIGTVLIMSGISVVIGISMWPYLTIIGQVATMFTIVIFGCAGWLAIAGTRQLVGIMSARRHKDVLYSRVIVSGDVVAVVDRNGVVMSHLSAEHEKAKTPIVVQALPPPKPGEPDVDEELILEYYDKGQSIKNTAKYCNVTEYKVREVVNKAGVTRTKSST